MSHTTGAAKDLSRSLRKNTWSLPGSFSSTQRYLSGPSSLMLLSSLEVFFAFFGIMLVFQAAPDFLLRGIAFADWHMIFAVLLVLNSGALIYSGIRREITAWIVRFPLYLAYLTYLTYPLAIRDAATGLAPWCEFIGLFGLITPVILGSIHQLLSHTAGLTCALVLSLWLSSLRSQIEVHLAEVVPVALLFLSYALLLGFFFYVARFYTTRSDVLYSETLGAQLKFNRYKDHSHSLQEFDKLVHDNVMAALLDASRVSGPIADRTRALAQRAIGVLEDEANRTSQNQGDISFQELTEQIAIGVAPWNSRLRFVEHDDSAMPKADPTSEIPYEAARAFTHAVTEAVSNSARHSGTRTTFISITTEMRRSSTASRFDLARPYIYCTVEDRGQGFNIKNLDMRRMGVRVSMIRSMEEAGGKVKIVSAPYKGTSVTIQWPGD